MSVLGLRVRAGQTPALAYCELGGSKSEPMLGKHKLAKCPASLTAVEERLQWFYDEATDVAREIKAELVSLKTHEHFARRRVPRELGLIEGVITLAVYQVLNTNVDVLRNTTVKARLSLDSGKTEQIRLHVSQALGLSGEEADAAAAAWALLE